MSCCQYKCTWARWASATATAWVRWRMRDSQFCTNTSTTTSARARASLVRASPAQLSSMLQSGPASSVSPVQSGLAGLPHWPCTGSPNHWPCQAMPPMPARRSTLLACRGQSIGCPSSGRAMRSRTHSRMRRPWCHTAQAASNSTTPRPTNSRGRRFMRLRVQSLPRPLAPRAGAVCRIFSCGNKAALAPGPGCEPPA